MGSLWRQIVSKDVTDETQVDRFIKRLEKRQETVISPSKKAKRRKEKQAIVELVDETVDAEA